MKDIGTTCAKVKVDLQSLFLFSSVYLFQSNLIVWFYLFYLSDCGRCFGVSTQLTRHIRSVHEGRKDYVCPTCAKAFTSTKTMNEHIDRNHRLPKDKICNYCGAVFNVQKDLIRHIKKQHKTAVEETVKDNDISPPPMSLPPPILH